MATNRYVNATTALGSKVLPGLNEPGTLLTLVGTFEKTAADTDASVLRIGKIPANAVPLYHTSRLHLDAIAGLTSVDLGVYKPLGIGGAEVDKNLLSAALDLHLGAAIGSSAAAFQTHPAIEEFGLTLKALVEAVNASTTYDEEYDLAFTFNTGGANVGTISWSLQFMIPQA